MTVGQMTSDLGVITSANTMMLKMMGYTKRDFVGQNIATIIPSPISLFHQASMMTFVRTGREVRWCCRCAAANVYCC